MRPEKYCVLLICVPPLIFCLRSDQPDGVSQIQLVCGQTVELGMDHERTTMAFQLVKQKLEWVKKPCILNFTASGRKHDGVLLTFLSHTIPSLLPKCDTYSLLLHINSDGLFCNESSRNTSVNPQNESTLDTNLDSYHYSSSIRLCSINWDSSMASFVVSSGFSLEVKHPLISNVHLELTTAMTGEIIRQQLPNPTNIEDHERMKFNGQVHSPEADKKIANLMSNDEHASSIANTFESIAPDIEFKFSIMVTSLNRSTMYSLAEAATLGSYVRNGNICENISTYFISSKNWPLSESIVDSGDFFADASQVLTLQNKNTGLHSGWTFFILQGPRYEDGSFQLNNCSEASEYFVSFTSFYTLGIPATYCGFDSNGTRIIKGENVTIHIKYARTNLSDEYPSGVMIGYLPFSAITEHQDLVTIPDWTVFLMVCSAIFIFLSIACISLHQKSKTVNPNERKPLLSDYQFS